MYASPCEYGKLTDVTQHDVTSPTPAVISVDRRPVRVCYLIDRLLPGGTEKHVLALISGMDRACVQPYLCLLDGTSEISREMEPTCCQVVRLGIRSFRSFR